MVLKKIFVNWAPVVATMILIFILSSRQRVTVSESFTINFLFFKSLHIIEYAFLNLLIIRGVYKSTKKWRIKKIIFLSSTLSLLYAISDEVHQTYVPTRNGTVIDVFIDSIGIFFSSYYTYLYLHIFKKLK